MYKKSVRGVYTRRVHSQVERKSHEGKTNPFHFVLFLIVVNNRSRQLPEHFESIEYRLLVVIHSSARPLLSSSVVLSLALVNSQNTK